MERWGNHSGTVVMLMRPQVSSGGFAISKYLEYDEI
jgi:hypothetical protein